MYLYDVAKTIQKDRLANAELRRLWKAQKSARRSHRHDLPVIRKALVPRSTALAK
jgi:hypothetical protein